MCGSLVIIAKRFLVARNIHIIRLVLNSVSAEAVGVIQLVLVYLCFPCCPQGCPAAREGGQQGCALVMQQWLPRTDITVSGLPTS